MELVLPEQAPEVLPQLSAVPQQPPPREEFVEEQQPSVPLTLVLEQEVLEEEQAKAELPLWPKETGLCGNGKGERLKELERQSHL